MDQGRSGCDDVGPAPTVRPMAPSDSTHNVTDEQHRLRLDRFLAAVRPDLGRQAIDRLLRIGAVKVSGRSRGRSYFVKHGDTVEVAPALAGAESQPHAILYSEALLAVAKPPGMPTNPVERSGSAVVAATDRDLLSWAIQHCLAKGIPGRPGIVHRLDRDTSGVVLFSLGPEGHAVLEEGFRTRSIRKRYLALVGGEIHPRRGTIDLPLARDRSGRMRPAPRGAPARTEYRTLRSNRSMSLIEVQPRTGRMHQVRAHLAAIGHAIAGDPLYGDPRRSLGAPRLWLHAESVEFPEGLARELGAPPRIASPLWEDLEFHLRALGVEWLGQSPPVPRG